MYKQTGHMITTCCSSEASIADRILKGSYNKSPLWGFKLGPQPTPWINLSVQEIQATSRRRHLKPIDHKAHIIIIVRDNIVELRNFIYVGAFVLL